MGKMLTEMISGQYYWQDNIGGEWICLSFWPQTTLPLHNMRLTSARIRASLMFCYYLWTFKGRAPQQAVLDLRTVESTMSATIWERREENDNSKCSVQIFLIVMCLNMNELLVKISVVAVHEVTIYSS